LRCAVRRGAVLFRVSCFSLIQRSRRRDPGHSFDPMMRCRLTRLSSRVEHRSSALVFAAAVVLFAPLRVSAQATLNGIVVDRDGVPLTGVTVTVNGAQATATTDERGRFRLSGIADGPAELRARRLGFAPVEHTVQIASKRSADGIELRMTPLPAMLSPVLVSSKTPEYRGRLAGYYQRLERRSAGYFISRDEIDRKNHRALSQLLRNVPGLAAIRLRSGGSVRMRGRTCRPLVWIDGVAMPAGEVDLDAFPTSTIHGIEVYPGSTGVPQEFSRGGGGSACGTIALWSRGPDTDVSRQARGQGVDLERLVQSLKVYSPDQVEKTAVLLRADALELGYPPELYTTGVEGSVLAEFVVDATGQVERETLNMVASTHPLFTAAVVRALRSARYSPALKDGKPVRQVIQQPFRFLQGPRRSGESSQ